MDAVCSPNTPVADITRGVKQRKSSAAGWPTIDSAMLKLLRPAMTRILTPLGRALVRRGIGPNAVTAIGTLGHRGLRPALLPLGTAARGRCRDHCLRAVRPARRPGGADGRGRGSTWGAFLDSTLDRVADAAIFAGLILYFVSTGDALLTAVTLFCLVAGLLVSYAKARAEGLGLTCDVGLAERPERLVVVLVAACFGGLGVPYILAAGMWLLAAASAVTVVQRVVHVSTGRRGSDERQAVSHRSRRGRGVRGRLDAGPAAARAADRRGVPVHGRPGVAQGRQVRAPAGDQPRQGDRAGPRQP